MSTVTADTPISFLTIGQLRDEIRAVSAAEVEKLNPAGKKTYLRGIQGIADALSVSTCRAAQIKASGIIDEAISQDARTIIVDVEKARELFFAFGKKKKK